MSNKRTFTFPPRSYADLAWERSHSEPVVRKPKKPAGAVVVQQVPVLASRRKSAVMRVVDALFGK